MNPQPLTHYQIRDWLRGCVTPLTCKVANHEAFIRMRRLSKDEKQFGPITFGTWHKNFSAYIESGDDEDPETMIVLAGFRRAIRIRVWKWLCRPYKERFVQCDWGGRWVIHPRRFGVSLSDVDNGYDFLQVYYGVQHEWDNGKSKNWSKLLPWKQWDFKRVSIYNPDGEHFYTHCGRGDYDQLYAQKEACPKLQFEFEDYDEERITATCMIEEREWRKGSGWFKWLRFFFKPMIRRSLEINFSAEVGRGKGSYKGGTTGHGIEMQDGESVEQAFRRYCEQQKLRFVRGIASQKPPASREALSSPANT